MKKLSIVAFLFVTALGMAQEQSGRSYFRMTGQFGIGFGFDNIDVVSYDEFDQNDNFVGSGESSISGGGGWSLNIGGEYIFNSTIGIGLNMGYQSSNLRPILEDGYVRFTRVTFLPTVKYLIGLTPSKNQTLNLGLGYGFYTGGKMKFDVASAGLRDTIEYNGGSGLNILAEYETMNVRGVGFVAGLRYYGVTYDIKQATGVNEFDELDGSGIDLYFGVLIEIK